MNGSLPNPSPVVHRFRVLDGLAVVECPIAGASLVAEEGDRRPVLTCSGCGAWGPVPPGFLGRVEAFACSSCSWFGCLGDCAEGKGKDDADSRV